MALAAKMDSSDYKIYVLLGDGELNEGQVWEAALTAAHYSLDNLIVIVDRNGFQLTGSTRDVKSLEPLHSKWEAFGWDVLQADGNDPTDFLDSLEASSLTGGKPIAIIAHTIKGKGVSFMEEQTLDYHGKAPTPEEEKKAIAELCHLKDFEI